MSEAAAQNIDVGSTLVALARTLDSDQLGHALGLTTMPAPSPDGDDRLGAIEPLRELEHVTRQFD